MGILSPHLNSYILISYFLKKLELTLVLKRICFIQNSSMTRDSFAIIKQQNIKSSDFFGDTVCGECSTLDPIDCTTWLLSSMVLFIVSLRRKMQFQEELGRTFTAESENFKSIRVHRF